MQSSNMGGGSREERIDGLVAEHVLAIQVLTGQQVLALIMLDATATPCVVTPAYRKVQTLQLLANMDWQEAYLSEASADSRM